MKSRVTNCFAFQTIFFCATVCDTRLPLPAPLQGLQPLNQQPAGLATRPPATCRGCNPSTGNLQALNPLDWQPAGLANPPPAVYRGVQPLNQQPARVATPQPATCRGCNRSTSNLQGLQPLNQQPAEVATPQPATCRGCNLLASNLQALQTEDPPTNDCVSILPPPSCSATATPQHRVAACLASPRQAQQIQVEKPSEAKLKVGGGFVLGGGWPSGRGSMCRALYILSGARHACTEKRHWLPAG
eukprot:365186-Chlamydomonas_euryale.AAC.11